MAQPISDGEERSFESTPDARAQRRLAPVRPAHKPSPMQRAELAAPVRKAAKAVVMGAALQIGASLAMRYLANQSGKQAGTAMAARGLRAARRQPAPSQVQHPDADRSLPDDAEIVSETLVVRRVWIRRRN